jgi:hypothetical protein
LAIHFVTCLIFDADDFQDSSHRFPNRMAVASRLLGNFLMFMAFPWLIDFCDDKRVKEWFNRKVRRGKGGLDKSQDLDQGGEK